jgi:hypothetical protein
MCKFTDLQKFEACISKYPNVLIKTPAARLNFSGSKALDSSSKLISKLEAKDICYSLF